jgi:hypothetical protein
VRVIRVDGEPAQGCQAQGGHDRYEKPLHCFPPSFDGLDQRTFANGSPQLRFIPGDQLQNLPRDRHEQKTTWSSLSPSAVDRVPYSPLTSGLGKAAELGNETRIYLRRQGNMFQPHVQPTGTPAGRRSGTSSPASDLLARQRTRRRTWVGAGLHNFLASTTSIHTGGRCPDLEQRLLPQGPESR